MGRLIDSDFFGGRVLRPSLPGGKLYACKDCASMFRFPILPDRDYAELYEASYPTQWSRTTDRKDLLTIQALIEADFSTATVMDIGCGTGEFLNLLSTRLKKFGIEPSAARHIASRSGTIEVVRDIGDLPNSAVFQAITVIDVIEHIKDVGQFLESAYSHLCHGGKLIISTGDPTVLAWRLLGSKFWYSSFPEHITFPSAKFIKGWCDQRGARLADKFSTAYKNPTIGLRFAQLLMQGAYFFSPSLFSLVGRIASYYNFLPSDGRKIYSPGVAGLFVDHQILVIRKPSALA